MTDHQDRRSPYLVLGVDYGTPIEQARKAFARRARDLRRNPSSVYDMEDLTWALHTIETLDDPAGSVEYFRVPANRAPIGAPTEGELFWPDPLPLPRRSGPVTSEQLTVLRAEASRELIERVLATATSIPRDNPYLV
jgi:hypothetical protein